MSHATVIRNNHSIPHFIFNMLSNHLLDLKSSKFHEIQPSFCFDTCISNLEFNVCLVIIADNGVDDDGLHIVADPFCVNCGSNVGWTYIHIYLILDFQETAHEKYKEGKSVERVKLSGSDEISDMVCACRHPYVTLIITIFIQNIT
ncbi:yippee-like protein [Artemisia annua]|uniref:Yippee-like protein n=1 Tax=Artemisia annua TaxID=35608 RepID=A0A2U1M160_ARTAN|nr:yippee-like protein [Artemisia annua]